MKVLVTGAAGQVGRELVDVFGQGVVGLGRSQLDATDRDAVLATLTTVAPDVVVNAAAFTAVDACESEEERAFAVNAHAVGHLADACRGVGARLVQISTDYVFDGTKEGPYSEADAPNPLSVYGRSKLAGERAAGPDALVVRTSWVFGAHGSNMVKTILRLAAEHDTLGFVDDQRGCPTSAADLASMIHRLVVEGLSGTFHVTNAGAVSWFEFAREVLSTAGLDPDRVEPISTADMPRPAPRPANSVLDNAALRRSGIEPLGDFRGALARVVESIRE
jgi:dTDP-4-dehydrorhamnose reductase